MRPLIRTVAIPRDDEAPVTRNPHRCAVCRSGSTEKFLAKNDGKCGLCRLRAGEPIIDPNFYTSRRERW